MEALVYTFLLASTLGITFSLSFLKSSKVFIKK